MSAPAPAPMVLIPAWNEAAHLGSVLRRVRAAAPHAQIVVVDDGSSDATAQIAAAAGATVLRHPFNLGYGAAVQTGYKWALAEGAPLLVQLDADEQHDPAAIPTLCDPVVRGELDLVVGSRFLGAGDYRMGLARRLGRALFRGFARASGLAVTDPTSGFQALGPRALALFAGDFFPSDYPDVDVLVAAHRAGLRIGERPVAMSPGVRPSLLHGGLAPVYYAYKMLLSTFAATAPPREGERDERPPADRAA